MIVAKYNKLNTKSQLFSYDKLQITSTTGDYSKEFLQQDQHWCNSLDIVYISTQLNTYKLSMVEETYGMNIKSAFSFRT